MESCFTASLSTLVHRHSLNHQRKILVFLRTLGNGDQHHSRAASVLSIFFSIFTDIFLSIRCNDDLYSHSLTTRHIPVYKLPPRSSRMTSVQSCQSIPLSRASSSSRLLSCPFLCISYLSYHPISWTTILPCSRHLSHILPLIHEKIGTLKEQLSVDPFCVYVAFPFFALFIFFFGKHFI